MSLNTRIVWDTDLIKRHDLSGPRYTSYPTAMQFDSTLSAADLVAAGQASTDGSPLSLYVHIPFCAHVCYYCACNKVITRNRNKAQPYLDTLYRELDQLSQWYSLGRSVNQLHWGGGTPTFISHRQMEGLMTKLRESFNLLEGDGGDYSIEIDPREASTETLDVLRQIGFNRISLGVQDIHPDVQAAVNRIQSTEETASLLAYARKIGFKSINIDLIYGLPFQTLEGFKETLDTVIQMSPDRLSVFNYAHMPDRFRAQKHISTEALPSPSTKLAILQASIQKLQEAGYLYIGMDHFAKPDDELAKAQQSGQLHRNFQGYTTHADCDLIAAGVSAISQIGDVYYQNDHHIETYTQLISTQGNAIKRGVKLNTDDHLRRAVITQLICHFELDFAAIEAAFAIDFNHYFTNELAELRPLEQDGLLTITPHNIKVSAAGRLLIRRICMAFDRYIPAQHTTKGFSRII